VRGEAITVIRALFNTHDKRHFVWRQVEPEIICPLAWLLIEERKQARELPFMRPSSRKVQQWRQQALWNRLAKALRRPGNPQHSRATCNQSAAQKRFYVCECFRTLQTAPGPHAMGIDERV